MASVGFTVDDASHDRLVSVSDWRRCLWKDWRSIRGLLFGVVLAVVMLQIAFVVAGYWSNPTYQKERWNAAVYVSFVGPVILSLACVGLFIGKERDDGSWNWNSSLPIAWHVSLASNMVIASLCVLISLACLMIIPSFVFAAARIDPATFASQVFLTLLSCMELFLIVGIFLLLIREAIIAIVTGLLCIAFCQMLFAATIDRWSAGSADSTLAAILLTGLSVALIATALAGFVYAYRWRWTYGQWVILGKFFSIRTSRRTNSIVAPTRRNTTFWLSWVQSFWLRAIGVCLGVSMLWLGWNELFGFFGMSLIGMSTFAGDQSRQRFRFLADRGANVREFFVPRLAVSLCIAIPVGICMLIMMPYAPNRPTVVPICVNSYWLVLMFLIGNFAVVCFRSNVIAVAVSLIMTIGAVVINQEITVWLPKRPLFRFFGGEMILLSAWVWAGAVIVLWITLLSRWVSRWLILERSKLAWRFLVLLPLASVSLVPLAAAFGIVFGFLMLPPTDSGPVRLASIDELKTLVKPQLDLAPLLAATERISNGKLLHFANSSNIGIVNRLHEQLETDFAVTKADVSEAKFTEGRDDLMADLRWEASQFGDALKRPKWFPENRNVYVPQKHRLTIRYLLASRIALYEKDVELANQFFDAIQILLDASDPSTTFFSVGVDGMIWKLLCTFRKQDMEALGGVQEFQSILDSNAGPRFHNEAVRISASIVVAAARSPESLPPSLRHTVPPPQLGERLLLMFPPTRWYLERLITVQMQELTNGIYIHEEELDKRLFRQHLLNVSAK